MLYVEQRAQGASQGFDLPSGPVSGCLSDRMFRRKLRQSPDAYSTVTAMASCRVPVLFVHGAEDGFVPVEMTYENARACAAPHRLVVVPGAGHGMSYAVDPAACEQEMLAFWAKYDR